MPRHIPVTQIDIILPWNLQSTMFLVKYFDLQIYNFLKLPVYNLKGLQCKLYTPKYLSTIYKIFHIKVVDSTTDFISNLQSTKSLATQQWNMNVFLYN